MRCHDPLNVQREPAMEGLLNRICHNGDVCDASVLMDDLPARTTLAKKAIHLIDKQEKESAT